MAASGCPFCIGTPWRSLIRAMRLKFSHAALAQHTDLRQIRAMLEQSVTIAIRRRRRPTGRAALVTA